eukprot:gene43635-59095_t
MWLSVNGRMMQDGSSKTMVYGVAHLVSYLSQFMSLHPGDVISTGTPPGVGLGMKPPQYLKAGDVVELGIEGLGTQKQTEPRQLGGVSVSEMASSEPVVHANLDKMA